MKRFRKRRLCLLLIATLIATPLPQTTFAAVVESHSTKEVRSVAHRGYSQTAPENTLIAYQQAKEKGFTYVECDVAFTADGVAVLLHDDTIDRTSDGAGNLSELTYEQLLQYDFGSWKGAEYIGTKIPTFEEFIALCAELDLHPYIELKRTGSYTQDNIRQLTEIVDSYGVTEKATWISFSGTLLHYVKNVVPSARLGYISASDVTEYTLYIIRTLQTKNNEVFLELPYQMLTETGILRCTEQELPIEVYTVNSENDLLTLPSYVSGVTSDHLLAQTILTDSDRVTFLEPLSNTAEK